MRIIKAFLFCILIPSLLLAKQISLTLDTNNFTFTGTYPVRSGIPFAKGELTGVKFIRILEDSKEVPAQFRALAFWPDGSVKWLLTDFFGKAGGKYAVEYGPETKKMAATGNLSKVEKEDIVINTGVLKFTVKKTGEGFPEEIYLDLNKDGKYTAGERMDASRAERKNFLDLIHLKTPGDFTVEARSVKDGTLEPSKAVIDSLSVEEDGPLHCVILVRGNYLYGKAVGETLTGAKIKAICPFTLRLHAFAGKSFINIQHNFVFDGADPDYDIIRSLGFALPVNFKITRVDFGAEKESKQIKAENSFYGLTQETADSYKIWEGDKFKTGTLATGKRSKGWMSVSGEQGGVAVIVRKNWQNYPKQLMANIETGLVDIFLAPLDSAPLTVRRYAREFGVGETGSTSKSAADIEKFSRWAGKGVSKTHNVCVSFFAGDFKDSKTEEIAANFDNTLLAAPSPEYFAETLVFGHYMPVIKGKYDKYEKSITNAIDFYLLSREVFGWYGFFDYGDIQQWFNMHNNGRWENDFGRWGWGGNDGQGRVGSLFFQQYLRTLDRKYFELGEAFCVHNYDCDVIHTKEYSFDWESGWNHNVIGNAHRHNVQHWGCPYIGLRGANPVGSKVLYYLTGDGQIKDTLDLVLAASLKGDAGAGYSGSGTDGWGSQAQSFLVAWETTKDTKYRDKLKGYIANLNKPSDPWALGLSYNFGLLPAIMDYYEVSGDPEAKKTIISMAEKCLASSTIRKHWSYPDSYFGVMSYAYRLSGEKNLRKNCWLCLKTFWARQGKRPITVWIEKCGLREK